MAVAATAISKVAEWHVQGGRVEWWRCTIDPGSITGDAQEIDTIAVPGAKAGDPCFVSAEAPEAAIIVQGAKVTGDDSVSVYLSASATTNSAALTYNLHILKRTVVAA